MATEMVIRPKSVGTAHSAVRDALLFASVFLFGAVSVALVEQASTGGIVSAPDMFAIAALPGLVAAQVGFVVGILWSLMYPAFDRQTFVGAKTAAAATGAVAAIGAIITMTVHSQGSFSNVLQRWVIAQGVEYACWGVVCGMFCYRLRRRRDDSGVLSSFR